jgi:hypothetical protein
LHQKDASSHFLMNHKFSHIFLSINFNKIRRFRCTKRIYPTILCADQLTISSKYMTFCHLVPKVMQMAQLKTPKVLGPFAYRFTFVRNPQPVRISVLYLQEVIH